jgi:hypothetical protein
MGYRGRWAVCRRNAGVDDRNLNSLVLSHRSEPCEPGTSDSLSVGVDQICLLPGLWAPVSRINGVSCAMQGKFDLRGPVDRSLCIPPYWNKWSQLW